MPLVCSTIAAADYLTALWNNRAAQLQTLATAATGGDPATAALERYYATVAGFDAAEIEAEIEADGCELAEEETQIANEEMALADERFSLADTLALQSMSDDEAATGDQFAHEDDGDVKSESDALAQDEADQLTAYAFADQKQGNNAAAAEAAFAAILPRYTRRL